MLGDDLRFETYQQWKQYVCNKFINYRTEELMEFSRYLNYEKRSTRPMLFILLLSFSIIKMMYPIFDNNIDENFYADYKEIIDDVIKERVV